ncbi:DUF3413 domain-containing protein [Aliarcobacter skirrowii]|uniref:DUF3413 domain-containing protein n=1 Tax=Aliarcobacter skirrowii TaxID=28200 RepID=UPI0021B4BCB0|nr:DUF3413 domain-containing protein [Aliarcobacter skirrowii]MCT7447122.1 DUF3413 domain-containing protein [Aliarcobacter skirrowii]
MEIKDRRRAYFLLVLTNILILLILSTKYYEFLPEIPNDLLGVSFIIFATFSHISILVLIFALILFPVIFLPTKYRYIFIAFVVSFLIILFYLDTIVFSLYRFHINYTMVELILSGGIVEFSLTIFLKVLFSILGVFLLQILILSFFERTKILRNAKIVKYFYILVFLSFIISSCMHIWAAAYSYSPITSIKKYLPLYQPMTATSLMRKQGFFNEEEFERRKKLQNSFKSDINYPINPLEKDDITNPPNIVILLIDSWRFDSFTKELMPNLYEFSNSNKNSVSFNNHIASGNSTRAGVFGLFYGIVSTYWHGMLSNNISPVFIDRLQELNYEIGIFASAKLYKPEFDKTVFRNISNLRIESAGDKPWQKDVSITNEWIEWHKNRDKNRPNFTFLFYDSPHGTSFPEDYEYKIEPYAQSIDYLKLSKDTDSVPYLNRYKMSAHFVDSLLKGVIEEIKNSEKFENTIIIITGDHAEEFNDNKDNYWGHNSNFTSNQVKVPFIIIDPKNETKFLENKKDYLTSHNDVVPTILKNHLGIINSVEDYSNGVDLYSYKEQRDWVVSASYNNYAIISNEDVFEVTETGAYRFYNNENIDIKDRKIDNKIYIDAINEISRFYR